MTLVSVLMPAYNAGLYVRKAVQSILSQTYAEFELIVLDDGSKDDTFELVSQFLKSDKRIKLLRQENSGVVVARNKLLQEAEGDVIAWMDADDISSPERLEVMLKYLQDNKRLVALGCGTLLIDEDGDAICDWKLPAKHKEIDERHLQGQGGAITFASSMMKKDVVLQVGGFQTGLAGAEDLDLFLKLAEVGLLQNLNEKLYNYRQYRHSLSHAKRVEIIKNTNFVVSSAYARRFLHPQEICTREPNVSTSQLHRKWAWWALNGGNKKTAKKHAWRAFYHAPFSSNNWRVLFCAMRGY